MTKETVSLKDKIVDIVSKATTGIDKKSLADSTVKGIQLEGALSKLLKDKILKMEVRDGQKFYFVAAENEKPGENVVIKGDAIVTLPEKKVSKKDKKEKPDSKVSDEGDENGISSDKKELNETKRDMKKFKFSGQQFTKGGLVHAIVKEYVSKHKQIGIAKLKEVFPDELIQRFGVLQEVSKAKQFTSGGRDRYFLKEEMVIKLKDNKKIAVCNQWTSDNIKPFLSAVRKLGFEIR